MATVTDRRKPTTVSRFRDLGSATGTAASPLVSAAGGRLGPCPSRLGERSRIREAPTPTLSTTSARSSSPSTCPSGTSTDPHDSRGTSCRNTRQTSWVGHDAGGASSVPTTPFCSDRPFVTCRPTTVASGLGRGALTATSLASHRSYGRGLGSGCCTPSSPAATSTATTCPAGTPSGDGRGQEPSPVLATVSDVPNAASHSSGLVRASAYHLGTSSTGRTATASAAASRRSRQAARRRCLTAS